MRRRYASSAGGKKSARPLLIYALLIVAVFLGLRLIEAGPEINWDASPNASAAGSGSLKVHFLDVGQADSEFIELPDGKCMLIDAGNPENGGGIVSAVKGYGHTRIDYLIATHPHADHIGGMAEVVNSLEIGAVYMPRTSEADTPTTACYRNLLTAIQNKGLSVNTAKAGVTLLGGDGISAVFEAPNRTDYAGDLNQYSAVLLLNYGSNRFLFMGDAGYTSENEITSDIRADVLKVGHHGSSTSSGLSFLKKVMPKYAVIEAGKDNSYGDPSQAALGRLQKIGAAVYRTDQLGTITFTSDGTNISVDKTPAA